jgi:hypothetical protein
LYNLGLSKTNKALFEAALVSSGKRRITITIRDHDEKKIADLTAPAVIEGAVQVDATASVTRSLSLTCLDPNHKLQFDYNSPASGALDADNFVSVEYGVYITSTDSWVDVPVFWGPLTDFQREGAEVTIEAQGKETLGLDPHLVRNGYTIHRGTTVANAIKNVMNRLGETRYNLETVSGRLHKHRAVIPGESPWAVVAGGGGLDSTGNPTPPLVSKVNGHAMLFYNGIGRLSHRTRNQNTAWVFTTDQLVSQAGFHFDILNVRNHVEVKGGTPKKSKKHFRGHATLPDIHPLSPYALRRNGQSRYMVEFFESDSLKSDADCRTQAELILAAHSTEGVEASFECLPIPHLEEYDHVTLNGPGYSMSFPLQTFTIPLTTDASMSVGASKAVRPRRRRHHR